MVKTSPFHGGIMGSNPVGVTNCGSIAQLGEHLPYKQRVTGSSPVVPTKCGQVAQLVRVSACHAEGRGFDPLLGRHFFAGLAQLAERLICNQQVVGSSPIASSKRKPPFKVVFLCSFFVFSLLLPYSQSYIVAIEFIHCKTSEYP